MIVAFEQFVGSGDVVAAIESQLVWLAAQPEPDNNPCLTDAASKQCSELLIATVEDWVSAPDFEARSATNR